VQEPFNSLTGIPAKDLLSLIDRNKTQINNAGVNLLSYIAPGSTHTVLSDEAFYTEQVNGQRFVDWVTRLIERKPVDDVHCRQCRVGRAAFGRPQSPTDRAEDHAAPSAEGAEPGQQAGSKRLKGAPLNRTESTRERAEKPHE
jgi:hypothetical protein